MLCLGHSCEPDARRWTHLTVVAPEDEQRVAVHLGDEAAPSRRNVSMRVLRQRIEPESKEELPERFSAFCGQQKQHRVTPVSRRH